jgi:NTP pyrophosphatase (non-canonical NTP hydrolase)
MIKTVKEWLEELPDGYRERALENMCENFKSVVYESMGDAISGAFTWDETQEGGAFWMDVRYHYDYFALLPPLPNSSEPKHEQTDFSSEKSRVIGIVTNWGLFEAENAKPIKQAHKLIEEAAELIEAEASGDVAAQEDAVGDCLVVLINYCHMKGYSMEDCLKKAADVIEKRTGKIVNGKFIKDQE